MKIIAFVLVLMVSATALTSTVVFAEGKSGKYRFSQLHPQMQKAVKVELRKLGIDLTPSATAGLTTSDCPSDCDDKVAGGFCYCDPVAGKCPGSSEETSDGKCKAKPKSLTVDSDGGGPAQAVVVSP